MSIRGFAFSHPLLAPMGVLLTGGAAFSQVVPYVEKDAGHQRIAALHIVVIVGLGAVLVFAVYLLLRSLLGSLIATGQSFDTTAATLMAQAGMLASQVQHVGDRVASHAGQIAVLKEMVDTQDRRLVTMESRFGRVP